MSNVDSRLKARDQRIKDLDVIIFMARLSFFKNLTKNLPIAILRGNLDSRRNSFDEMLFTIDVGMHYYLY